MGQVRMPPVERWFENERDYWACYPSWRRTPGGRALHAFYGPDPLCGVRPVDQHGQPIAWRPVDRSTGRGGHRHAECERLADLETARRKRALIERQRQEMANDRTDQL